MQALTVRGLASGRTFELLVPDRDHHLSLMQFLLNQGLPIASSCSGEGICKKCVVNKDLLSCQITLKEYLINHSEILISYL